MHHPSSSHNGKALEQAFTDFPDASFILSSGDQISYAFDTSQWDAFFEGNADKFARVPLYLAVGNHEYDGAGNKWAPNNSWDSVDPTLQNLLGRYNPPKNGASFYGGGDGTERMVSGLDESNLSQATTILFMAIHFSWCWIIRTKAALLKEKHSRTG